MTDNGQPPRCVIVIWGDATAGEAESVAAGWNRDVYRVNAPADSRARALDGDESFDAALAAARRELPDRCCLFLRSDLTPPSLGVERLERALATEPGAAVVSPLCDETLALWPLPPCHPGADAARLDQAAALVRPARLIETRAVCRAFSLWRISAVENAPQGLKNLLAWLNDGLAADSGPAHSGGWLCSDLYVDTGSGVPAPSVSDPRDQPAAGAMDSLRAQMAQILADGARPRLPAAGLAPRPVCLHAVHCWGGGIAEWTRSVAAHWDDFDHLVLVAWSNPGSDLRGQQLRLHAGAPDGPLLGCWTLPRPIRATDTRHRSYHQVLTWIIEHFAVDALCVSSLIGHSLELLETGLPTLYVFHDYYPLWPDLGLCFERDPEFSRAGLDAALQQGLFAGANADRWLAVRAGLLERLQAAHLRCMAPSQSVVRNLARVDDRFGGLDIAVISHGLIPLGEPLTLSAAQPGERLRLLLPGRIPPSKGRDLLLKALPRITAVADVILLGASKDGHEFFGQSHVHVVLEYERERLADMIRTVRPHLAMLLSTVSETFNLTLSEMWSLGLPVLATRVGALEERIEHGVTGWLVEPDADALADAIERLAGEPDLIAAMAASEKPATPMAKAVASYRKLLPAPAVPALRYPLAPVGPQLLAQADADRSRLADRQRAERLAAELRDQRRELDRRARWADEESRKARDRLAWAQRLERDLEQSRAALEALTVEYEARTEWAQALQAQLDERTRHVQALEAHIQSVEGQLLTVVNSRSWKLTRPLRGVGRLLRSGLLKLGIQSRRASSAAQRTRKSLKTRGLAGTVERIGRELSRGEPALISGTGIDAPDRDYEPLALPGSDDPEVSVIIPAYRHYEHTHACLRSLIQSRNLCQFEVIVVDDASEDGETADWLARHSGLKVVTNEKNAGFIRSCNRGAEAARGEFVVFLNNDTAVTDRWLDRLLEPFTELPDCGLVGARLVYPDGRLQEAGGIVFSDGSGWNYGKGENPDAPQFSFRRDVDYCSGAAIMLRRDLFQDIGGFDTRYEPAYYEDVDLAFEVRARGLRVLYQPTATVVHFEGISSGTDTSSGTKRYQVVNQEKFCAKWSADLTHHPAPTAPLDLSRRHRRPRSILIIDACTPRPDHDAGSVRMVNLMKILLDLGWHVRFLADNRAHDEQYTPALQQLGVEALYHPFVKSTQSWMKDHGKHLDAVLVSRHYVARNYVEMVRQYCPGAQLLFDTVDLHYLREQRQAELENDPALSAAARKTRARELDVARRCDVTLVVSQFEREFLASDSPDLTVNVLSTIVDVVGCRKPFAQRKDLLFVGGFQHPPNADAVLWFVGEVLPLLQRELPGVRLHVIGSRVTDEVRALASDLVLIHGFVPDIEPWLDDCRLSLAPLRFGAGVKGKINTAMAYGQPVIATPTAVEGMHVTPGEDVLVGETPRAFADAVIEAYRDEALWNRLSAGGLKNVETHFSFSAAREALKKILRPA